MFAGIESKLTKSEQEILEAYRCLLLHRRAERAYKWLSENSSNLPEIERKYRERIQRNRRWNRYEYNLH